MIHILFFQKRRSVIEPIVDHQCSIYSTTKLENSTIALTPEHGTLTAATGLTFQYIT